MATKKSATISNLLVPNGDWYAVHEDDEFIYAEPVALWGTVGGKIVGLCSGVDSDELSPLGSDILGYVKVPLGASPDKVATEWYQSRLSEEDDEEEDEED